MRRKRLAMTSNLSPRASDSRVWLRNSALRSLVFTSFDAALFATPILILSRTPAQNHFACWRPVVDYLEILASKDSTTDTSAYSEIGFLQTEAEYSTASGLV